MSSIRNKKKFQNVVENLERQNTSVQGSDLQNVMSTAAGYPQQGIAQTPPAPPAPLASSVPVPPRPVTSPTGLAQPVAQVTPVPAPLAQPSLPSASLPNAPVQPTAPAQPPKPPVAAPKPSRVPRRRRLSPRVRWIIIGLLALILLGWLASVWFDQQAKQSSNSIRQEGDVAGRFDTIQLPLSNLGAGEITLQGTQSLRINGKLEVGGTLVITPTAQPTSPTAGQLYYDQASNLLAYFNGTEFIQLVASSNVVQTVGGQSGNITVGQGLAASGGQISNTGVLDVQGTGPITSTGGQNPELTLANGTTAGQIWQWDGDSWELTTLPTSTDQDGIIGNEVTDVIVGGGLTIRGSATAADPLKLGLQACDLGEVLKSNGNGAWICAPDAGGSSYAAGNGLQLTGSTFSVNSPTCAGTDKLRWTGSAFACAADVDTDTNTTYTAGTGLNLTGTTFNNTGTLSVTASGALQSSGGQNPNLSFVNGTTAGQFWQWDGDSWELATISGPDGDGVIGNEVTNVIANGGLTRAGTGTAVDPYLLGLQSCLTGQILKSTAAGVWECATDGGDGNTTYTADGQGIELTGTVFSLELDGATLSKSTSGLRLNLGNPNTWTASQTFGAGLAISGGQSITMNGDVVTDLTGTGITVAGGALQAVLGTSVDLGSEVTGSLPVANGGTGLSGIGTAHQLLGVNSAGTGLEYKNIASLLGAGSGIGLSGTNTVTITNNGVLSVGGTGPVTSTGGQNPSLTFAVGTSAGQFWQWDGDSWELATLPAEQDAVVGNEVVGGTGSNSGLVRSGTGTAGNPYTLAVNTGNGLQLATNQVAINSPTCAGTDKLQWSGSAFVCSPDVDTDTNTTYSAISNGGLRLVGTQFGLSVCSTGQILKATAVSGEYACAADADTDTTYSAGTGLSLVGTTFNNTGVLSVAGSGAITSTGGQNPTLAFANGTTAGQFWQWDGDSWELATTAVDGDSVVGNEITNVVASGGLTRSGAGTVGDPFQVRLQTCSTNEVLKSTGVGTWGCAADNNTTYTADGQGIELTGSQFSLELNGTSLTKGASGLSLNLGNANTWTAAQTFGAGAAVSVGQSFSVNGEAFTDLTGAGLTNTGGVLQATLGTSVDLSSEVTGTLPVANGGTGLTGTGTANQLLGVNAAGTALEYKNIASLLSAGTGIGLSGTNTVTITNNGVLSVAGAGPVTSTGGQNPTINFTNGTSTGQFWQWDGDSWELATLAAEQDAVIGNEVVGITGANAGLVRSGSGTAGSPYTLAVNPGDGLQLATNQVSINSPTCAGTDKLQWTGSAFVCSADVDTDTNTTYSAINNGGLRLVGTQFGLSVCTTGQILKATAVSGEYACAADADTTYSAGTGLSLVGTTFNNTGALTVTGSGAITSSGGQNPNIAFANGTSAGQFWQWDGDSWELVTLAADGDSVVGNEITNVVASGGLTRSGTGTVGDPYQVRLQTCTTNQVLKSTGVGTWGCAADDNTTYTADGQGIELTGSQFSLELNGASLSKGASGLSLNLGNANTWTAAQTFSAGAAVSVGQSLTVNGEAFTDLTGTGLTISGGALQATLGTSVDLGSEVTGTLPVARGGTGLTALGSANQLMGVNAAGTALEYKNIASLLTAGTGISLSGTTNATINNTGVLTVAGTGPITSTGGQNPTINFANGSATGQFWQWNGSAWALSSALGPNVTCDVAGNFFCMGGNTKAATVTLGTNDAQSLVFETNNTTAMTINSSGQLGVGVAPSVAQLSVKGNGTGVLRVGGDCGSNYTAINLNGGAFDCTSYNIMGAPSDALYINRQSGGAIHFREGNGTSQLTLDSGGAATFRNTTNSNGGFKVQNASGTNMLQVDTLDNEVEIGASNLSTNLRVAGDVILGTTLETPQSFEGVTFPPTSPGTWTTGGNANWTRGTDQAQDGTASAGSGTIADAQSTFLDLNYTFAVNGTFSFYWKVSSEGSFDFLRFCVDNDTCTQAGGYSQRISGSTEWAQVVVPVTAGAHSFRWVYEKDTTTVAGSDKGWIDSVRFTGGGTGNISGETLQMVATSSISLATNSTTRLHVNSAGNVGIGTQGPSEKLTVNGNFNVRDADVPTKQYRFRTSGAALDFEGAGGWLYISNWQNANYTGTQNIFLIMPNDGANMRVMKTSDFYRTGAGDFVRWVNEGTNTVIGSVAMAGDGTTVQYLTFTGSHAAWTDEQIDMGMLVSLTGDNRHTYNNPDGETIYGVKKTAQPNDPATMGSYMGMLDGTKPYNGEDNYHTVSAVGNGYMWVDDQGGDIKAGDYLISSGTPGHAMKDNAQFPTSYVVARAADSVNWSNVTETINGRKHKKVSVFYESFSRLNSTGLREAVFNGGIVSGDTTFKAMVNFEGEVNFKNNVTFSGNVAGTVTIPAGQRSTTVRFNRPHAHNPVVNATPKEFIEGTFRVKDVTTEEFTIELLQAQPADILFNWSAITAKD